ncbi:MAG: alpha/beta hydrolase [Actinomycetota bacterium]
MPKVEVNGVSLYYERRGKADGIPLLLIMGLGAQLISWPEGFVDRLVDAGHNVVLYDNRDVGLSTYFDEAGTPDINAYLAGDPIEAAYFLSDLGDDAAGLIEALGWSSAHVLGVSMGGMIAQELAIRHPQLVKSLTSVMSTTGNPELGQPTAEAVAAILNPAPTSVDEAEEIADRLWRVTASPGFEFPSEDVRLRARAEFLRAAHPAGTLRQMVAIALSPDRTAALGKLTMPVFVIHGEGDCLVSPSGGQATAAAIPGSSLWMIPGMGHDLPRPMWDEMVSRISAHVASSSS